MPLPIWTGGIETVHFSKTEQKRCQKTSLEIQIILPNKWYPTLQWSRAHHLYLLTRQNSFAAVLHPTLFVGLMLRTHLLLLYHQLFTCLENILLLSLPTWPHLKPIQRTLVFVHPAVILDYSFITIHRYYFLPGLSPPRVQRTCIRCNPPFSPNLSPTIFFCSWATKIGDDPNQRLFKMGYLNSWSMTHLTLSW